jgi:ferritin-like metal-binding protein YciE
MEQARMRYLAWLRDAHAMEEQALTMMQGIVSRLEKYPELRSQIRKHISETKEQLSPLGRLLDRQGAGSLMVKDTMGRVTALAQSISGTGDEVVKGTLASYTCENMEIAS